MAKETVLVVEDEPDLAKGVRYNLRKEGYRVLNAGDAAVAAMADPVRRLFAVQFHPEVAHTPKGIAVMKRFLYEGCGLLPDWTPANVIERAAVLGDGPEITGEDLPLRIAAIDMENPAEALSYRHVVDAARADVVKRALAHTNGNRAAAARILGLHKTHLLNLMKSLRIE